MSELLVPTGAVHERLGVRRTKPLRVRTVSIPKLRAMGHVWLRRDRILDVLRAEYEATEHPTVGRLLQVLEEGTA